MDLRQDKIKQQVAELTERIHNYEILIGKERKLLEELQSACGHPRLEVSNSGWSARCSVCQASI